MTTTAVRTSRRTWWQMLGYLAKRATLVEVYGYVSIYRFVFRRPRVPAGSVGFAYHQPILSVLIVFIVLSAMELLAVDLIVRRWDYIRIPLLILSVWGVVWMLGLLFGMLTRPHAVGSGGIRVRSGAETDIVIDWVSVDAVAIRKRTRKDKEPKLTVDQDGEATLHLRIANETNLEIELDRPRPVRLPHGTVSVRRIALWADDPKAFLAEVRRHIG